MIAYIHSLNWSTQFVCSVDNYENICRSDKTCFEILTQLRFAYFDFDLKAEYTSESSFIDKNTELISTITSVFGEFLPNYAIKSLTTTSTLIYPDSRLSKHSFHVVLSKIDTFGNLLEMCQWLNDKLKDRGIRRLLS